MLLALCFSAEAQQAKKIARIGFLSLNSSSSIATNADAFRQGLRDFGYVEGRNIVIEVLEVRGPEDIESAFDAAKRKHANALLVPASSLLAAHRKRVNDLAAQNRFPAICFAPGWAEDGCLLAYGPNTAEFYRRVATYVDKILKGAKPADLPVEQPMKFELVVNLKTAKQIGMKRSPPEPIYCFGEALLWHRPSPDDSAKSAERRIPMIWLLSFKT